MRETIGATRLSQITLEFLIDFAKRRARDGAGPVTIEQVSLARIALNRLGLVAKSAERDRRSTQDELDLIIKTAEENPRQIIPTGCPSRVHLRQGNGSSLAAQQFDWCVSR